MFGTARRFMTVQYFVDTNVLVYAARPKNDEPGKSDRPSLEHIQARST
jgi:hypothetical protein